MVWIYSCNFLAFFMRKDNIADKYRRFLCSSFILLLPLLIWVFKNSTAFSPSGSLIIAGSPAWWFSWLLGSVSLHIYSNLHHCLMLFSFFSFFVNVSGSFFAEIKAVISFLSLAVFSALLRYVFFLDLVFWESQ